VFEHGSKATQCNMTQDQMYMRIAAVAAGDDESEGMVDDEVSKVRA